ncbi:response regulator [Pararcticibacter amylolyticus]|uniref:Response regulator n=1 Tax=Pararcticibacter amylolyticus TaxID=2173175 RepID=A0A2U2PDQ4_9SPHI|nr:response regulator [Pararcticibacter amylolyticus]PWG79535.1 response regulator [Pararcticibacter amylolyticus]
MFERVLIAEDHHSVNSWVKQTLKDLGTAEIRQAHYCDDAFRLLQIAIREGTPFDLLITDLSFREDRPDQKLHNGAELIGAVRSLLPELKILVFSAEDQPAVARSLYDRFGINGYVPKGPRDEEEMRQALTQIAKHKTYIPREFQQAVRAKNAHDFTKYDVIIISELAQGTYQKNIPFVLEKQGFKASSLSSVEKRLCQIRDALGFTKNEQLIAYCKDHLII